MPEKAYTLSIRLSTDGFSFSIYNPIRDSFVLSKEYEIERKLSLTANVKQAFKELDFLSNSYKQVNVSLVSKRFTLLPIELFDEDQVKTCFYYNYPPKENETVLYNTLPKTNAVVLFGVNKSLYHFLLETHPQVQFYSSVTSLAEHFALKSRIGSDKKMYACLHGETMELYAYERGHLMLLNAYDCAHVSDRVYYLLYAWKQLQMDQLRDELCIVGGDSDRGQFVEELQRFVQHISIEDQIPEFNKK